MASPRMKLYIDYSADIYEVYLKYIAKEDIHVYSIDEAFLDVTHYLSLYRLTAMELAVEIMADIKRTTGITATAGIGTNLYLAKVALDVTAKHAEDNIGCLDEEMYQNSLWDHKPITDFWRVGAGTAKRLADIGIFTMGDIAHADEDMLYRMFGVDAELLIDHAWGRESAKMADIKAYKPKASSLSSGQVLMRDYTFDECRLIIKEMTDALCLELTDKGMVTKSVSLNVGYSYQLGINPSAGTVPLPEASNSCRVILPFVLELYGRIVQKGKAIRRVGIVCNDIMDEACKQYDLFTDYAAIERDKKLQNAVLEIKRKYGKNAVIRGMDLLEAATAMERNRQIGGHKSGG